MRRTSRSHSLCSPRRRVARVVLGAASLVLGVAPLVTVHVPSARAADTAGMRVYRDPATGEFTAPPDDATVAPEGATSSGARAVGVAPPALVEEPGESEAGGVTIDLQGGFRSSESATVDAAGNVHTHCHTNADGGATP